jgi:hypothetical protein
LDSDGNPITEAKAAEMGEYAVQQYHAGNLHAPGRVDGATEDRS